MYERAKRLLRTIEKTPGLSTWLHFRYNKQFAMASNVNWFNGIYDQFDQAVDAAPATKPIGYDNHAAASATMYKKRIEHISPCDYPVMFWLQKLLGHESKVLDYGGHVGILFYALSRYDFFPAAMQWTVFDLPTVVGEGRDYALKHGAPAQLSFVSQIDPKLDADIVLFSGSLQYLNCSISDIIAKLHKRPRYVLINMLPVHRQHQYVTLQNIGTAFCPYLIRSEENLKRDFARLNSEVVDSWSNPDKSCIIKFEPDYSLHHYQGYLLELTSVTNPTQ